MKNNELYFSTDPKDIIKFYNMFNNAEELFNFLSEMPKESVKTTILRNDDDIVVVVPTADINNTNSKKIINTYKDYTIVFVESRGKYFNFSHSMNIGIEAAISLNPKWIMLTNDDIYIQTPTILKEKLQKIDENIIIPKKIRYKDNYVSTGINIYKSSTLINSVYKIRLMSKLFPIHLKGRFICNSIKYYKYMFKYLNIDIDSSLNKLFFIGTRIFTVYNIQPVSIIKARILDKYQFDEIFQNGGEDLDLSLRLKAAGFTFYPTDLNFFGQSGSSLGINNLRLYRNTLIEILYISYKLQNHIYK